MKERSLIVQHPKSFREADEMEAASIAAGREAFRVSLFSITEKIEGEPDRTVHLNREDARMLAKLIVETL